MLQNLFNYWYDLEFFSPCWPVDPSRDIDLAGHPLPWPRPADQAVRYSYDIYLGKAKACRLVSKLMDTLGMRAEDRAPEYDNALVCLCALKVDQAGQYVAGSFGLSSFAWAISCLMAAHRLDARLDPSALEKLQARTDEQLCEAYALPGKPPFCKADLIRLYRTLLRQLGFAPEVFFEALWARPKKQHANKDGSFPPLDPSTELVQSFYLRDLARIRQAPGPLVEQYALALQSPCPTRIQIDCDVQQMQRWLDAAAFPLGLWPAAHNPCLMQQLAVNLAIAPDAPPLFSVNGPPGTGKTTLLKEIVASNVVQRAPYTWPPMTSRTMHSPPRNSRHRPTLIPRIFTGPTLRSQPMASWLPPTTTRRSKTSRSACPNPSPRIAPGVFPVPMPQTQARPILPIWLQPCSESPPGASSPPGWASAKILPICGSGCGGLGTA